VNFARKPLCVALNSAEGRPDVSHLGEQGDIPRHQLSGGVILEQNDRVAEKLYAGHET
jgi:hypothetical protein